MIQFHDKTLLVQFEDGHTEPIHMKELFARLVGDPALILIEPWLLEQIVESVFHFCQSELQTARVSRIDLLGLIHQLQKSFQEQKLNTAWNRSQLDLFEVASTCGTAYEWEFFAQVRQRLLSRLQSIPATPPSEPHTPTTGIHSIEVTGLRQCCKYLAGHKRWSKRCMKIRDEIVSYIRLEATRLQTPHLNLCILS